jgi:hypothetical protein
MLLMVRNETRRTVENKPKASMCSNVTKYDRENNKEGGRLFMIHGGGKEWVLSW